MAEFPLQWREYARIQKAERGNCSWGEEGWAREAVLSRILAATEPEQVFDPKEIARAMASARRRERYRSQWQALYLGGDDHGPDPAQALEARAELRLIKSRITGDDWLLLHDLGTGHEYDEMATDRQVSPGSLRVRVMRLRRMLMAA